MDFIQMFSGDVKEGRSQEYQTWLAANEPKIAENAPDGAEYIGTYFAMYSSEKGMGGTFTLWRMESYGTQDNFAAAAAGTLGEIFNEWADFIDQSNDANFGSILLKRVTDATIWGSNA